MSRYREAAIVVALPLVVAVLLVVVLGPSLGPLELTIIGLLLLAAWVLGFRRLRGTRS